MLSLAMAEMALVPSIYRAYTTRISPGFEGIAPGITSRFEVFTDETFAKTKVSFASSPGRSIG
jgi:hypothetical protein